MQIYTNVFVADKITSIPMHMYAKLNVIQLPIALRISVAVKKIYRQEFDLLVCDRMVGFNSCL